MKAVIYTEYGPPDVLQLQEVAKPTPGNHDVLVKIRATSVTIGDVRMRKFDVPRMQWLFARLYLGILKPKRPILGMEIAGEVEAVGAAVTRFKPGDEVFASTLSVGIGGYAQYKCMPEDAVMAFKPAHVTFEEAAAGPATGGITALLNLRKAGVHSGQRILIYGASGSVGTFAVQLAKDAGAYVTGVCSAANLDMVKCLGADEVIDYTQEDFTRNGETYDLVFDAVGKLPSSLGKKALNKTGVYLNVNSSSGKITSDDLTRLKELMEAGKIRSVIDRCYPLEATADAHRYVEQGHKKGNVAIIVNHSN